MSSAAPADILLVEDSTPPAEMTARALRKAGLPHRLTWVKDGAEALEVLFGSESPARGNPQPRLVLLDLKMPRVDGIEVLRRMKADERTRAIPVVVLSSSAEEPDLLQSYALGANSYLVKPVDYARFVEDISRVGFYWLVMNRMPAR